MTDADLTRPIEIDDVDAAEGAAEASRSEALTKPVESIAEQSPAGHSETISPVPAFRAADAEDTGQIVLPPQANSRRSSASSAAPEADTPDMAAREGAMAPGGVTPGSAAPGGVVHGGAAPDDIAPGGVAPDIAASSMATPEANPVDTALYLGAFFQELVRCGVRDVVISPGSRSTALAMVALESAGEVYVDVDERGAAFFALGLAKATGNPVAVVCTSGTAPANWFPAVLEAEASRVPLLLLSADRPPRLQGVSAHQTTDQLGLFGAHVKRFYQMPLPSSDSSTLSYARQIALDAAIAAHGAMPGARSCDGGPVHVNFPFEEPLKPASLVEVNAQLDNVGAGRKLPPTVVPGQVLLAKDAAGLLGVIAGKRVVAVCGEGSANNADEARAIADFAQRRNVPLLADPLSGLRNVDDPCVIDNYDTVLGKPDGLLPEVVVRFGRWPVSKRAATEMGSCGAIQLVVDLQSTRDAAVSTTTFVRTTPVAFARGLAANESDASADEAFFKQWIAANEEAASRIAQVGILSNMDDFEGAYVDALFDMVPEGSLVYSANSMSVRAVDTFYRKTAPAIDVLCNRGLSGIDGTLSAAIGASYAYDQTTVICGDLAFLHDANALALQGELRLREHRGAGTRPNIVVVVLNNNGGGIFDMLPQRSSDDYFERLFLTPQRFNIKELAAAFEVPYRRAVTVASLRRAYTALLGQPGINVIEVPVPLAGVGERYGRFW